MKAVGLEITASSTTEGVGAVRLSDMFDVEIVIWTKWWLNFGLLLQKELGKCIDINEMLWIGFTVSQRIIRAANS